MRPSETKSVTPSSKIEKERNIDSNGKSIKARNTQRKAKQNETKQNKTHENDPGRLTQRRKEKDKTKNQN